MNVVRWNPADIGREPGCTHGPVTSTSQWPTARHAGDEGLGAADVQHVTPRGFENLRVRLKVREAFVTLLAQECPERPALVSMIQHETRIRTGKGEVFATDRTLILLLCLDRLEVGTGETVLLPQAIGSVVCSRF